MESILGEIKDDSKPRLLLHACCAPCSTAVLECLERYFAITVFFYNPNLETEAEYHRRAEECKRLLKEMKLPISCIVFKWQGAWKRNRRGEGDAPPAFNLD